MSEPSVATVMAMIATVGTMAGRMAIVPVIAVAMVAVAVTVSMDWSAWLDQHHRRSTMAR